MKSAGTSITSSIAKETAVLIGGAICAAFIMGKFPQLRAWIQAQWGGANAKLGG